MTVAKVVSASYDNLGRGGTRKDNEMVAIDGIILTTSDFADTIANITDQDTWDAGIKAKTVFPLEGLDDYEDQSQEDTLYDSPLRNRKLTKRGQRRYMFLYDMPFSVHRTLMTHYNNADLRVWILRDGKLYFYNDGGTAKGFSTSMINIGRLQEVPSDGSTPSRTPVYIDLENYRELDMYGEFVEPSWNVYDLQPLVDVTLEEVDSGSLASSATLLAVMVYSQDGYDSDGAAKKVGIKGIVQDDFTYTASGGGSVSTFTDNGDGTYTFAGTGFADGDTIALKTPENMTNSTFVDLRIEGTNTVTIAGVGA